MKILVLGAGGIIGQHLRLSQPENVEAIYTRISTDRLHVGSLAAHYRGDFGIAALLSEHRPEAVINLAGENRPDVVEQNPSGYRTINIETPAFLSSWCEGNNSHLVQVSTQAVFGGVPLRPNMSGITAALTCAYFDPPFSFDSPRVPVNMYGVQKLLAEQEVGAAGKNWTIVRPTFVLGVRPMPGIGRENPVEHMLAPVPSIYAESESPATMCQVCDRWFSVAFAWDVAAMLWSVALGPPQRRAHNVGIPYRTSRHVLASYLRPDITIEPVSHDSFEGLAPRPVDTTYAGDGCFADIAEGLDRCKLEYEQRKNMTIEQRATEIVIYLSEVCELPYSYNDCLLRLQRGFGRLHNAVSDDWRDANPQTDAEILKWYQKTFSYIWELSAYHMDPGFNYAGMMRGISEALKAKGAVKVLVLGDGIGDMSMHLAERGFAVSYHDLKESHTADFALSRFLMHGLAIEDASTWDWTPAFQAGEYDAVVSLDFLEHVTDVEAWVRAIFQTLRPGGWLMAQNAFACGSGPDGSMPMHLARNDRFEKDWDPLLIEVGFRQEASNWYQK